MLKLTLIVLIFGLVTCSSEDEKSNLVELGSKGNLCLKDSCAPTTPSPVFGEVSQISGPDVKAYHMNLLSSASSSVVVTAETVKGVHKISLYRFHAPSKKYEKDLSLDSPCGSILGGIESIAAAMSETHVLVVAGCKVGEHYSRYYLISVFGTTHIGTTLLAEHERSLGDNLSYSLSWHQNSDLFAVLGAGGFQRVSPGGRLVGGELPIEGKPGFLAAHSDGWKILHEDGGYTLQGPQGTISCVHKNIGASDGKKFSLGSSLNASVSINSVIYLAEINGNQCQPSAIEVPLRFIPEDAGLRDYKVDDLLIDRRGVIGVVYRDGTKKDNLLMTAVNLATREPSFPVSIAKLEGIEVVKGAILNNVVHIILLSEGRVLLASGRMSEP